MLDFTTTGGRAIKYKAWLTGREANELQTIYLGAAKIKVVNEKPQMDGFDPSVEIKATQKIIEIMVVSVDGKTEDVVNLVLDMKQSEYDEVVAALNEVAKKK